MRNTAMKKKNQQPISISCILTYIVFLREKKTFQNKTQKGVYIYILQITPASGLIELDSYASAFNLLWFHKKLPHMLPRK